MLQRFFPFLLCLCAASLPAQDASTLQIHGFATQSVLFSRHNNFLEPRSSDGDPGWTEAVVSFTDQPTPKLRVGLQLHYFRLGDLGDNAPFIDWASGDYKFNQYLGVRAGKVKSTLGLFTDSQDIDAVLLWSLLPQSVYPIDNRSFSLAHLGGEIYGDVPLGEHTGRLRYRAFGGSNSLPSNGGLTEQLSQATGLQFSSPVAGPLSGADLRWLTPFKPLTVGVSVLQQHLTGTAQTGSVFIRAVVPVYYAQYDHKRLFFAGEYRRQAPHLAVNIGPYAVPIISDQRQSYVMVAVHATDKLQLGTYFSRLVNVSADVHQQQNNSRDFVLSSRYDFNANFYAKAEQHFLHGTLAGFYPDDNRGGLRPRTAMTIAKVGFTF